MSFKGDPGPLPKLYDVFLGEVASIQHYGIFVKIPGSRKNGLVHKSQMSSVRIEHPDEVVTMGESVYCKVISIDEEEKIGLTMKTVNQTSGKDQDPNHVQTSLDEQRRKTGHVREIKGIHLGAVLDTTCKKCGGKGHLAKDCFHMPGDSKYDLLPDVDYMAKQEQNVAETDQKKRKKHKKEKKKHKKKQKRRHSESDSEDETKNKRKKHKRKKERGEESSDSESDSGVNNKRRRDSSASRDRHQSSHRHRDPSLGHDRHSGETKTTHKHGGPSQGHDRHSRDTKTTYK